MSPIQPVIQRAPLAACASLPCTFGRARFEYGQLFFGSAEAGPLERSLPLPRNQKTLDNGEEGLLRSHSPVAGPWANMVRGDREVDREAHHLGQQGTRDGQNGRRTRQPVGASQPPSPGRETRWLYSPRYLSMSNSKTAEICRRTISVVCEGCWHTPGGSAASTSPVSGWQRSIGTSRHATAFSSSNEHAGSATCSHGGTYACACACACFAGGGGGIGSCRGDGGGGAWGCNTWSNSEEVVWSSGGAAGSVGATATVATVSRGVAPRGGGAAGCGIGHSDARIACAGHAFGGGCGGGVRGGGGAGGARACAEGAGGAGGGVVGGGGGGGCGGGTGASGGGLRDLVCTAALVGRCLISSLPWANWHLWPYLQVPSRFQLAQSTVLYRTASLISRRDV